MFVKDNTPPIQIGLSGLTLVPSKQGLGFDCYA